MLDPKKTEVIVSQDNLDRDNIWNSIRKVAVTPEPLSERMHGRRSPSRLEVNKEQKRKSSAWTTLVNFDEFEIP